MTIAFILLLMGILYYQINLLSQTSIDHLYFTINYLIMCSNFLIVPDNSFLQKETKGFFKGTGKKRIIHSKKDRNVDIPSHNY